MATYFITGGHSGLGLECSKLLASSYHPDLVLAGRDITKMEPIAKELRDYGAKVCLIAMDTSSLASVRAGAAKLMDMLDNGEIDPLQGIICNAGVRLSGALTYTSDGYETTFATNYLGHFLLTELLIDRVAANGRVVFTTSGTHDPDTADGKMMGIAADKNAFQLAKAGKEGNEPVSLGKLYATSKLDMILHIYELDRRLRASGSSVAAIAYDPGATPGTGFLRAMPKMVQWLADTALMHWIMKRSGVTIGAIDFSGKSLARIAADPAYGNGSGKYFQSNDGKLIERRSSKLSYDQERALKLWDESKTLVHLKQEEESVMLKDR